MSSELHVSYNTIKELFDVEAPSYYCASVGPGFYSLYSYMDEFFVICDCLTGDEKDDYEGNYKTEHTAVNSKDDARLLGFLAVGGKLSARPRTMDGAEFITLDAPQEDDRRVVMVNSPGREGSYTWITSRGDDPSPTPPASGRGDGALSALSFTEPATKEVEIHFTEAMQLLGGEVYWRAVENWDFEDNWSLLIRVPATIALVNETNTGNCNVVPTGLGFNIIVPAAGDGGWDVDLEMAVPVPDGYSSATQQGIGYWDVDRFWSEIMTPNGEGQGEFNLYDLQLEFFFCKHVSCGNPNGTWSLKPYKAEWVSSRWIPIFQVTKTTAGAGKIGGLFHVYRPGAT